MKTSILLARPAGALFVAAALLTGIFALLPNQAQALGGVRCFCPPVSESIHGWGGHPSSCATARNLCLVDVQSKADQYCSSTYGTSVCQTGSLTYQPPTGCMLKDGMQVADCDLAFSCQQCIDLP